MNILVLGVGNMLLQDEGVGVRALEALGKKFNLPPEVELLDGGTSGMELLGQLQDRDALVIIDAVHCKRPPGTILRVEGERVPAFFRKKISPHQLGLSDLLAAARLTGTLPGKVVLFGVEPQEIGTGVDLTPKIAAVLDELTIQIALELEHLGVAVKLNGTRSKKAVQTATPAVMATFPP